MNLQFGHMSEALRVFVDAKATQSQEHIKPFHQHVAIRLVVEGGFLPDEVTPHPPLVATRTSNAWSIDYDESVKGKGELTVFGGMKTKQIDVVAAKRGIGPVVAVSVKGTFKAYRNLVNRMEEAIGDSTNVHVMYPGLVYGFLHLLRANREADGYDKRDMGITAQGDVSPLIQRYCAALMEMTGRRFVRNDFTRYESVGLALVENSTGRAGEIVHAYPPDNAPLLLDRFFETLYGVYDLRFPFRAERLQVAKRVVWAEDSPLFAKLSQSRDEPIETVLGYAPRLDV